MVLLVPTLDTLISLMNTLSPVLDRPVRIIRVVGRSAEPLYLVTDSLSRAGLSCVSVRCLSELDCVLYHSIGINSSVHRLVLRAPSVFRKDSS